MTFKNGFKLIYEKLGKLFASKTGIPAEGDAEVEIKCGDEDVLGTEETEESTHEEGGEAGEADQGEQQDEDKENQTQSLSAPKKSRKKSNG